MGDSRAYLWEPLAGCLERVSQDHSLVERLVSAGLISEDEAKVHPQRHLITQCLGSKELAQLNVDEIRFHWQPEQVLMLCSDGLTEELSDKDMTTIFSEHSDIQNLADELLNRALNKGGQDNISFILLKSPLAAPVGVSGLIYQVKSKIKSWLK